MKWSGGASLLVGAAAIWGLSFVLMKIAVETVDPLSLMALRFSVGTLVLASYFFITKRKVTRSSISKGAWLGLFLFAAIWLQAIGLQSTTATNSAFITALSVVWVPLMTAAWLRKIPTPNLAYAVLLSVGGLFLMTRPEMALNPGDAITIVCALFFAIHILLTGRFAENEEPLSLVFVQLAVAAALGWLGVLMTGKITLPQAPMALIGVLYLGLFGNAIGFFLQTKAQKTVDATRAGVLLTTEPVFAGIFGFALLSERLGWLELTGAALILLSVWLAEIGNGNLKKSA